MNNIFMKCLNSEKIQSGACHGQFLINELKPGQGITIGNQLRRVLLGDLGGMAISAVRIAGVTHEFSTIPGVREDILDEDLRTMEIGQIFRLLLKGLKGGLLFRQLKGEEAFPQVLEFAIRLEEEIPFRVEIAGGNQAAPPNGSAFSGVAQPCTAPLDASDFAILPRPISA